jgi:single-strand DNA-binding protein
MTVNRVQLIGNVGKDPEIRKNQSGGEIASFSLATSESWKDKATGDRMEKTEWHNIVVFNEHIVNVVRDFVKKGTKLYIEAKIQTRKWQDKEGKERQTTEIIIDRFNCSLALLSKPNSDDSAKPSNSYNDTGQSYKAAKQEPISHSSDVLDDDIPF